MPVLLIRGLPQPDSSRIKPALKKACLAIADIYGCPPSQVWATWEEIRPGWYVEGTKSGTMQKTDSHPPIAELWCFEGKSPVEVEEILLVASRALTEGLGLGENIFIRYVEMKAGTVISGNGIIRR